MHISKLAVQVYINAQSYQCAILGVSAPAIGFHKYLDSLQTWKGSGLVTCHTAVQSNYLIVMLHFVIFTA